MHGRNFVPRSLPVKQCGAILGMQMRDSKASAQPHSPATRTGFGKTCESARVNFLKRINVICPVQFLPQKYSPFRLPQISSRNPAISSPTRGVSRSSRTLGWDAVDAAVSGANEIAGRVL